LLRTEDAGATWTSQLAWPGNVLSKLRVFDAQRASLVLGLWPTYRNEINAQPVAPGEPFYAFLAGTENGGATWSLGSMPDSQGTRVHFLTLRQIWLLISVSDSYPRADLAHTEDGGATWSRIEGAGDMPMVHIGFADPVDGLMVAQDRHRADNLYRTTDGGATWTRQQLVLPTGVPESAETWLFTVHSVKFGTLLTLRAVSRRQAPTRPQWEGTYGYASTDDGWNGPYRLPMPPAAVGYDVLAVGSDGRLWGVFGHDVWIGDGIEGPWQQRRVPLPSDEHIDDICAVGDGVLWLTTSVGVAGGALYRSVDDGVNWDHVPVEAR
jgi:hypothetical protein